MTDRDPRPAGTGPLVRFQLRDSCYGTAAVALTPTVGAAADGWVDSIDLAEDFHEASKISAAAPAAGLGPSGELFLTDGGLPWRLGRPGLAHAGTAVRLPRPRCLEIDLVEVCAARTSGVRPGTGPVTLAELGTVLGLSAAASPTRPGLRTCPSAGALYPLDVIAVVGMVDGLPAGAYVYDPQEHAMLKRSDLALAEFHARAAVSEPVPAVALTLAVVATFARSRVKYGLRGYRFALIEAGHLVQAMITAAVALGLSQLPWGGFVDVAVDGALELDGVDRSCVYLLSVAAPDDRGPR